MNFETPLSGGLLIVGSLLWDKHETRVSLRDSILNMEEATKVPAPIRYGRKSDKRQTFTMVVSPTCKTDNNMGQGILVPFRNEIQDSNTLNVIAKSIITAEHKVKVSFARYNWGWGCLAFLLNPTNAGNNTINQLKEYWSTKIGNGFDTSHYIVADEEQLLTAQAELLIDWKEEYGDLDFIVITATKPTSPPPTIQLLAEAFTKDDEYFAGNRNTGIVTHQDIEIQEQINLNHEKKS